MEHCNPHIPEMRGLSRISTTQVPGEICFIHKLLLENRDLTTPLLERLTSNAVAAESCNLVRNNKIFRSAVLTGSGRILVFARSVIYPSLLSRQARQAVLAGRVPLGRILLQEGMTTDRCNFTFFPLDDISHFPSVYKDLALVSPSFQQWAARNFSRNSNKPGAVHNFRDRKYFGRTYDIFFQSRRLARIEEIFSPNLECSNPANLIRRINTGRNSPCGCCAPVNL